MGYRNLHDLFHGLLSLMENSAARTNFTIDIIIEGCSNRAESAYHIKAMDSYAEDRRIILYIDN